MGGLVVEAEAAVVVDWVPRFERAEETDVVPNLPSTTGAWIRVQPLGIPPQPMASAWAAAHD